MEMLPGNWTLVSLQVSERWEVQLLQDEPPVGYEAGEPDVDELPAIVDMIDAEGTDGLVRINSRGSVLSTTSGTGGRPVRRMGRAHGLL